MSGISQTSCRLGPLEQIPVGEGRAFDIAGEQVAVFRLRNGSVRALSAVCPHRGGPIADGQVDGSLVMCPLHQNQFDLDTGCSTTGAAPLRTWPVEVDAAGDVVVTTQGVVSQVVTTQGVVSQGVVPQGG